MPPGRDSDYAAARVRRTRTYAIAALVLGLLATLVGLASGPSRWSIALVGLLMLTAGVYGLIALRHRHP
jgi:hypothetical protein